MGVSFFDACLLWASWMVRDCLTGSRRRSALGPAEAQVNNIVQLPPGFNSPIVATVETSIVGTPSASLLIRDLTNGWVVSGPLNLTGLGAGVPATRRLPSPGGGWVPNRLYALEWEVFNLPGLNPFVFRTNVVFRLVLVNGAVSIEFVEVYW